VSLLLKQQEWWQQVWPEGPSLREAHLLRLIIPRESGIREWRSSYPEVLLCGISSTWPPSLGFGHRRDRCRCS